MIQFSDAKDPDDIDDFTLDWSAVLATGETITACALAVVTGGVTVPDPAQATISGSRTTARVSGGSDQSTAEVRYRITTSAGRQLDETARIIIRSR